eukprot:g4399.t1
MKVAASLLTVVVALTLSAGAAQCTSQEGIVRGVGQDVGKKTGLASAQDCCRYCNGTATCAAWTFHKSGSQKGVCWLHSSAGGSRTDNTAISGMRDGPLPPTPPPTPKAG